MAQAKFRGILLDQKIKQDGKGARLTFYDLDVKSNMEVSLSGATLAPEIVADLMPRGWLLDGFRQGEWEGRSYLTCSNVAAVPVDNGNGKK